MSKTRPTERFSKSELGLRIASAIILLIIVVSASWVGGHVFSLMCAILSAVLFYEWNAITSTTPFDAPEAAVTAGFIILLFGALAGFFFSALLIFLALGLVLELTSRGAERSELRWLGLGALYCAIPVVALPLIREDGGLPLLFLLYLVVWLTDIGAYFAGRHFGGPKLMPAVSPKKTWSGALGGAALAVLVAALFAGNIEGWALLPVMLFGLFLSVCSQVGDLFESALKRTFGVKDSSALIPGHGGFLDRVDGLVVAAVPVALIVALGAG